MRVNFNTVWLVVLFWFFMEILISGVWKICSIVLDWSVFLYVLSAFISLNYLLYYTYESKTQYCIS